MQKRTTMLVIIYLMSLVVLSLREITVYAGTDDSNKKEVGVEWVEDYSGARNAGYGNLGDLNYTREDAIGFYNALYNIAGWTRRFAYGDSQAFERHFEKTAVGGQDYNYIDAVDFAYFSGHGDPNAFWFGTNTDGDNRYEFRVHWIEAEWGDKDLEWIGISACEILKYPADGRWGWPVWNNGYHIILGFHTITFDDPDVGRYFVYYMTGYWDDYDNDGADPIVEAWKWATKKALDNSNVYAAYLAPVVSVSGVGLIHYREDYLPGYGYTHPDYSNALLEDFDYAKWSCQG